MERNIRNGKGIFLLWFAWTVSSGSLIALVTLSLYVPAAWLPIVAYILQVLLFTMIRRNRESRYPNCYLIPFIASRILFWSGTVMLALNLLMRYGVTGYLFTPEGINPDIPFITVLIVAPISMAISGWAMMSKFRLAFCKDCVVRCGSPAERGFLGKIYTQESRHQQCMLFYMCTAFTVIGWVYYAFWYANDSLTVPDRLIYFGIPIMAWIATVIYFGVRCMGLWSYYCQNLRSNNYQGDSRTTIMRFILIHGNQICLKRPALDPDSMVTNDFKWDTPVASHVQTRPKMDMAQARSMFRSLTRIDDSDVRLMYSTKVGNVDSDIYHYLCFLTDEEKEFFDRSNPGCEWLHFQRIVELMNEKQLNPLMSAEIFRLHRVAMVWKTYTRSGRRRYKIKNYRPTFRVQDIREWDVDYNDPTWIYVASNNEDTRFYHARLFWRKYISGIGEYKLPEE